MSQKHYSIAHSARPRGPASRPLPLGHTLPALHLQQAAMTTCLLIPNNVVTTQLVKHRQKEIQYMLAVDSPIVVAVASNHLQQLIITELIKYVICDSLHLYPRLCLTSEPSTLTHV